MLHILCHTSIRKGATIACFGEKYYYLCKKQINHNYYDKQRINRKSL